MDIDIKKISGRCNRIVDLQCEFYLELFSYLNLKEVNTNGGTESKDDDKSNSDTDAKVDDKSNSNTKSDDSSVTELFPVKLKDIFTHETMFLFIYRCCTDSFDIILPIVYSKTNSQVLRNLIDIDFGDLSLSMKDIYKIKAVLNDSSGDKHKKVYTMSFSNDLGFNYDTFVGAKIVHFNSNDESIVSNAACLSSKSARTPPLLGEAKVGDELR